MLVQAGANVDAADASGAAPLHLVAACAAGEDAAVVEIAGLLASRGANQRARNSASERPVDTAHQRGRRAVIMALNKAWEEMMVREAAAPVQKLLPAPPPAPAMVGIMVPAGIGY